MRHRLQKEYGNPIVFTAYIWVRGTKKNWEKTICLTDIVYKGDKVDEHLWVIGECNIPKWRKVCVTGTVYAYQNYRNYSVKDCLIMEVPVL
jgi:hypothetical protein